jgi:hypothetical protein
MREVDIIKFKSTDTICKKILVVTDNNHDE